jgi:hypothetical protein
MRLTLHQKKNHCMKNPYEPQAWVVSLKKDLSDKMLTLNLVHGIQEMCIGQVH